MTWGRFLDDGGTLIDVISPSVSPDGSTIVFAGRRADQDAGRFRIYSTNLYGSRIDRLTGGTDDAGCMAAPPLRTLADGSRMPDADRRRTDYDDVDPILLEDGTLVFASSRWPDLGGEFNRRATQIWIKPVGEQPRPLSASRANDRWPFQDVGGRITFTLWSHQNEVVSADGREIVRHDATKPGITPPVDRWACVGISASSENFQMLVKLPLPVWRARATPRGSVAFMTTTNAKAPFTVGNERPEALPMRVAAAVQGTIASSPSSLDPTTSFPNSNNTRVDWLANIDDQGKEWSFATPAPLPDDSMLVAAAPLHPDGTLSPSAYGLAYVSAEGWDSREKSANRVKIMPLFDDPNLVDAEPVAVYARAIPKVQIKVPVKDGDDAIATVQYRDGTTYRGKVGDIHASILHGEMLPSFLPAQLTDAGQSPAVPNYTKNQMNRIDFYANPRDRFDDPEQPVVRGTFRKILEVPIEGNGEIRVRLPTTDPTMLVGVGPDGKISSAYGKPDQAGNRGKFYAFAGDHVSGVRAGAYHFCTGCHAGHTAANGPLPELPR